jgi:hypothetical protein
MNNALLWLRGAWRSRTMWAALAVIAAGVVQIVGPLQVIPPGRAGWVLVAVGGAMMALRAVTSTSIIAKVPGTSPPAK